MKDGGLHLPSLIPFETAKVTVVNLNTSRELLKLHQGVSHW